MQIELHDYSNNDVSFGDCAFQNPPSPPEPTPRVNSLQISTNGAEIRFGTTKWIYMNCTWRLMDIVCDAVHWSQIE